jgi:hypothetical protein
MLLSDRAKLFREDSGLEKPPHPPLAEVGVVPTLNGFPAEVGSLLSSALVVEWKPRLTPAKASPSVSIIPALFDAADPPRCCDWLIFASSRSPPAIDAVVKAVDVVGASRLMMK